MPDMGSVQIPGPFHWSGVNAMAFSWVISATLLAILVVYLLGARRFGRLKGSPWSIRRTISFVAGLVVVFAATQSVVGVYDMTLFTAHMIQHLALIMVAAGFFAMGAPLELATTTLPGPPGRAINRVVSSTLGEVIGHPIFGFAAYAFFIPATHLTSIFNLMLQHMWVHRLEQIGFLAIGYLFWRPVVAIEPSRHRLAPGLRLVYLALAVPVDTFTGLALVMSGHVPFGAYAQMHRTWGSSILSDIKTGGAVMWIGGDFLMLLAMIPIAFVWMRDEESKTEELDARLDAEREAAESSELQETESLDTG